MAGTVSRCSLSIVKIFQLPSNCSQLARLSSGMPKTRCFANSLPDASPSKALLTDLTGSVSGLLDTVLSCCSRGSDLSGGTVYVGVSGVALACFHVAQCVKAAGQGSQLYSDLQSKQSFEQLLRETEQLCESCLNTRQLRPHSSRVTFLEGMAGPLAMLTVTRYQRQRSAEALQGGPSANAPAGAADSWQDSLEALLDMYKGVVNHLPARECEILYGRAGYLWALLFIRKHLGQDVVPYSVIKDMTQTILNQGLRTAAQLRMPGLMYEWHDSLYLGAAHGLCGILYVLCHVMEVVDELDADTADSRPAGSQTYRQAILASIESLLSMCFPSGNLPSSVGRETDSLVQWCHGAPGLLQLLAAAAPCFHQNSQAWVEPVRKAAQVVWERGLLNKGVGLCHGISGNAYSLLSAARMMREDGHQDAADLLLHRAQQMAVFANEHWEELYAVPDRPASLYEGLGGLICLAADLSMPDPVSTARFPAFEL